MKILHLLASPFWSGPAENVALLALAQREAGHEVTVAVDRRRTEIPAEEPSVPRLKALGLLDEGGLELSVKSPPWAVWRDTRRLKARCLLSGLQIHVVTRLPSSTGAPSGRGA